MEPLFDLSEYTSIYSCGHKRYKLMVFSETYPNGKGQIVHADVFVFNEGGWVEIFKLSKDYPKKYVDAHKYINDTKEEVEETRKKAINWIIMFHDGT